VGALPGDLRGLGGLLRRALGLLADEILEIALVGRDPRPIQVRDDVDAAVEQPAVVADHDRGAREARQPALQPHRGFKVEVVGRLVEQQQVGLQEQRAGQRHAHPPAARIGGQRPRLRRLVEAEPGQDRRGARRRGIGADGDQPLVDLGGAVGPGVVLQRGEQRGAFGVGGQHGVEQRALAARCLLRDMAEARAGREPDVAAIGLDVADDRLQQRRLARAVPPDQPEAPPGVECHVGAVEQRAAADAEHQVADREDGHGAPL
jgi:hypothetical protein